VSCAVAAVASSRSAKAVPRRPCVATCKKDGRRGHNDGGRRSQAMCELLARATRETPMLPRGAPVPQQRCRVSPPDSPAQPSEPTVRCARTLSWLEHSRLARWPPPARIPAL
jgi:hypothetical protein